MRLTITPHELHAMRPTVVTRNGRRCSVEFEMVGSRADLIVDGLTSVTDVTLIVVGSSFLAVFARDSFEFFGGIDVQSCHPHVVTFDVKRHVGEEVPVSEGNSVVNDGASHVSEIIAAHSARVKSDHDKIAEKDGDEWCDEGHGVISEDACDFDVSFTLDELFDVYEAITVMSARDGDFTNTSAWILQQKIRSCITSRILESEEIARTAEKIMKAIRARAYIAGQQKRIAEMIAADDKACDGGAEMKTSAKCDIPLPRMPRALGRALPVMRRRRRAIG